MYRWLVGTLAVVSMVVLFQNCGKAGFESDEQINGFANSASLDSRLASLPFPYKISVNQISHMTCQNVSENGPYFSWKVGAFDNSEVPSSVMNIRPSGIQLSQEFIDGWNKIATSFHSSVVEEKFKETLMNHPKTMGSSLQFSFRRTATPRTTLMPLPNGEDSPSVVFMDPVSSSSIVNAFAKSPGDVLNLFPEALDFQSRFLEAKVNLPTGSGTEQNLLRSNYDQSYLAIAFVKGQNPTSSNSSENPNELVAPSETDDRFAHGKGFRVRFGRTNPYLRSSEYPASDSLYAVEEQDLETGTPTPGVGWDCSIRFKIVRPADRYAPMYRANHFTMINGACPGRRATGEYCASPLNNAFGLPAGTFANNTCPSNRPKMNGSFCVENYYATCPHEPYYPEPDPNAPVNNTDGVYHPNYPQRPAILHALRRVLPADQWDINVSRGCVVPKTNVDDNSCYGSGNQKPVYDELFFPGLEANPSIGQYAGCGVAGQLPCAAYVTLCVRR